MRCPNCGEEYFPPSVMERIDDIIEGVQNIDSRIFIISYKTAA